MKAVSILRLAAALAVLPLSLVAEEYNLRDYLINHGVADPTAYAEGLNDAGGNYVAAKLFNGVTDSTESSERWLAGKTSAKDAVVIYEIPQAALTGGVTGLKLVKYNLYRNTQGSDSTYYKLRAPLEWKIYGSNDKSSWFQLCQHTATDADWNNTQKRSYTIETGNQGIYRYLKFAPESSGCTAAEWKIGLMEIEYIVEPYTGELPSNTSLREYLAEKGISVASCVTGGNDAEGFESTKLFDGEITLASDKSNRWLAGYKDVKNATVTVNLTPAASNGLVVTHYIVHRIPGEDTSLNNADYLRAPLTWKIEYSQDNVNWSVLHEVTNRVTWAATVTSMTQTIPAKRQFACRYLRFTPLASLYQDEKGQWRAGLIELEYFVKEPSAAKTTLIIAGSHGDEFGAPVPGYGQYAVDATNATSNAKQDVDGVRYNSYSHSLEYSYDDGITWTAPVTNSGSGCIFTKTDGAVTRLTWIFKPTACRVQAKADAATETFVFEPAQASGGYNQIGASVTVTAENKTTVPASTFLYWSRFPEGAVTNGNQVTFTVGNGPIELNAVYARRWTIENGGVTRLTDGNWKFNFFSPSIDGETCYEISSCVQGSGALDFSTLAEDVGTGRRVRAISAKTFYGNVSVTSLKAPGLWYVREQCFREATALKSVHLPDIKNLSHEAFYGCRSLKSVTPAVLNRLNTIGYFAFYRCNLSETSLSIPALSRYNWTFDETAEKGGGKIPRNRAFSATKAIRLDFTGSAMTNVPPAMFADTTSADIVLPATLVSVDAEAFYGPAGGLQEVRFLGPPPTLTNNWAATSSSLSGRDYCIALGFSYRHQEALMADPTFVARANIPDIESKPNYAAVRAKYGHSLKGTWRGKWLYLVGGRATTIIMR